MDRKFNTVLLDKDQIIKNETCPNSKCLGWISGFPDTYIRPYKGKKSLIEKYQCWGCNTEFIQVKNYER